MITARRSSSTSASVRDRDRVALLIRTPIAGLVGLAVLLGGAYTSSPVARSGTGARCFAAPPTEPVEGTMSIGLWHAAPIAPNLP